MLFWIKRLNEIVIYELFQLYTGFWKLKVEPHLFNALRLFERMGYTETEQDVLTLTQPASKDTLIEVSMETIAYFVARIFLRLEEKVSVCPDYPYLSNICMKTVDCFVASMFLWILEEKVFVYPNQTSS